MTQGGGRSIDAIVRHAHGMSYALPRSLEDQDETRALGHLEQYHGTDGRDPAIGPDRDRVEEGDAGTRNHPALSRPTADPAFS